jgi:PAS domain S-box-containing protein/putative nucleotidyltransferase with HDIG domain
MHPNISYIVNYSSEQFEYISSMFDNFGDYLALYDQNGQMLYMNSHLLFTLNFSKEELEYRNFSDFYFSADNESIKSLFEYLSFTDRKIVRGSFIRKDGTVIPVKTKFTKIIYQGKSAILSLSDDALIDLSKEKMEIEHLQTLREKLGGVVQTIASAVIARDSYTAGHQQRVSDLARKIASRMGLSQHTIEGIRVAASLHDIGKITVPSDILNKSFSLLEMEFELIKHHTNVGFQILSSIDFPWPVAAIVYQHHEFIDGSGYPLGLEGYMMLTESKIVCVADVVEAMSTHRPYRPALGIETAMDEINRYRGIRFDPDVVDACNDLYDKGEINFTQFNYAKQNSECRYF